LHASHALPARLTLRIANYAASSTRSHALTEHHDCTPRRRRYVTLGKFSRVRRPSRTSTGARGMKAPHAPKTHRSCFTHFGRSARCLACLTSFRVRSPHDEALDCAVTIAALLDRDQKSMPTPFRVHSECYNVLFGDARRGTWAWDCSKDRESRSQHQAKILTIPRLPLLMLSIEQPYHRASQLEAVDRDTPFPIRKFIGNLIRSTSQPWDSCAPAMCFSSLTQGCVRSHDSVGQPQLFAFDTP
jgi:hypothetical protein